MHCGFAFGVRRALQVQVAAPCTYEAISLYEHMCTNISAEDDARDRSGARPHFHTALPHSSSPLLLRAARPT